MSSGRCWICQLPLNACSGHGWPFSPMQMETLVERLRAENARLRAALKRAIRALVFADSPEARGVYFADLVVQLQAALAGR